MATPKSTDKTIFKIRLKVGDTVMVRSGKYKGKTGKVTAVHPTLNKVTVEGINVVKKHQKPNNAHPQGGIIEITKPMWVSTLGVVEPTTKKPARVAFTFGKGGEKVRVFANTKKEIK